MKKGFTLVEMMVVVVVIGIIAAIAVPSVVSQINREKTAKAKGDLRALQVAVENYSLYNNSQYPASLTSLTTAVPSVIKILPKDPFSGGAADYVYVHESGSMYYAIYSVGPPPGGSVSGVSGTGVTESGANCIYVSNVQEDAQP